MQSKRTKNSPVNSSARVIQAARFADWAVQSTPEEQATVASAVAEYNEMRIAAIETEKQRWKQCCGCGKQCGKGVDGKRMSQRPDLVAGAVCCVVCCVLLCVAV